MSVKCTSEKTITCKRLATPSLQKYAIDNRSEDCFNDVKIIAGNETILSNRMVLACHSQYFEKLFKIKSQKQYQHRDSVTVNKVDGSTMKQIIDYFYSGTLNISNNNVLTLLAASDFLQLSDVKSYCFEFLGSILEPNNALNIANIAIFYKSSSLLDASHHFISIKFDEVARTPDFLALAKDELITSISNLNRIQTKETSIYQALIGWTNHDLTARKLGFVDMLPKIVILSKLPCEFVEKVVLKDDLITTNKSCHQLALATYSQLLKNKGASYDESKVVSFGGTETLQKCFDVYNLFFQSLMTYPDLPAKLHCHSSLKMGDFVYCIGGKIVSDDDSICSNKVWRINLTDDEPEWEEFPSMIEKRDVMGATIYRDSLVVAGGWDGEGDLASAELYLDVLDEWIPISHMNQRRSGHALVSCHHCLLALGGWDKCMYLASVERLCDLKGSWEIVQPMQTPRRWFAAVNCNGIIYAIGGQSGHDDSTRMKSVEKYEASVNSWMFVKSMNIERAGHSACVLIGKIFVVGGRNAAGELIKEIECYDTSNDEWTIVGYSEDELRNHSLVAM